MKKLLSILLSIILLVLSVASASNVFADIPTESIGKTQLGTTNTYYEYDFNNKILTISGNGATPNFSSNGQGQPWYEWRSLIKNVVFEEGITSIGNYFLYQVQADFELPSTLEKIGSYAFYSNNAITAVSIPFGVSSIGSYAFRYCSALADVSLSDTLEAIGTKAFEGCNALSEVVIPYSVKTLSSNCFLNCTALENVKFQSDTSAIKIGDYCFLGCEKLKEIIIPINATMGKCSYGYQTSTKKYTDAKMYVYSESNGYNYAISNTAYELYDSVKIECAVGYENTYTNDNINKKFTYKFTPSTTQKYNIYTRGDCDIDATFSAQCDKKDDISNTDRNFWLSADLDAGVEYTLTVNSVKSVGTYTLWVYPDSIDAIDILSTPVTTQAEKNMQVVDDSLLEKFVIDVKFGDGLTDKIHYKNDFFNGTQLQQKAANLTCGDTFGQIEIGSAYNSYPLTITHNYESKSIAYTVDSDGYTLYSCVLCDDSYKQDFVKSPAIKIKGRIVVAEDKYGNHPSNIPFTQIDEIELDDTRTDANRHYFVDENGCFELNSFNNFDVVLHNQYVPNIKFSFIVDGYEPYTVVDYGIIVVQPYDFSADGKINAKDYAIYLKDKRAEAPKDYFNNFAKYLV